MSRGHGLQRDLRFNSHAGIWKEALSFGSIIQNYKAGSLYNAELNSNFISSIHSLYLFFLIIRKSI